MRAPSTRPSWSCMGGGQHGEERGQRGEERARIARGPACAIHGLLWWVVSKAVGAPVLVLLDIATCGQKWSRGGANQAGEWPGPQIPRQECT